MYAPFTMRPRAVSALASQSDRGLPARRSTQVAFREEQEIALLSKALNSSETQGHLKFSRLFLAPEAWPLAVGNPGAGGPRRVDDRRGVASAGARTARFRIARVGHLPLASADIRARTRLEPGARLIAVGVTGRAAAMPITEHHTASHGGSSSPTIYENSPELLLAKGIATEVALLTSA